MDPSRSSEAASSTTRQEIPRTLWNPKVHDRAHKSLPLVRTLSQINPYDVLPYSLEDVLMFSCNLRAVFHGLLALRFATNTVLRTCHMPRPSHAA
jgi:hypothetical protein